MRHHPRSLIHYWKCDRPAAFHGTDERPRDSALMTKQLRAVLRRVLQDETITVRPTPSQGNHLTYLADFNGEQHFVRIEDGPEKDDYIEVESHIMGQVRELGLPVPQLIVFDASRELVPFAVQVMEKIEHPDLNHHFKLGTLDLPVIATEIGSAVATWQSIRPAGFGPFDPDLVVNDEFLCGFHSSYADYFHLHLDRHLHFLVERGFLTQAQAADIASAIEEHRALLDLKQGCLVHKDLALWNILGTPNSIEAFIDFDDVISGDPMDDLSLLGCFHDGGVLARALEGYESVRPLPDEHRRRFWLHLLRNMIVKAVIRVGAGYFERSEGFFLIGSGRDGSDLKTFTLERLSRALRGLREDHDPATL